MKPVDHIKTNKGMSVDDLVREMEKSGVFGAGRVARAVNILEKAISDKECKVFFGFAGAMVPGGMKQIMIDMLKDGWIDVFVTTGANLTHDLIEVLGHRHYQGTCMVDDKELNKERIDRIYESFMKDEVYEALEEFCQPVFKKMASEIDGSINIREFLWKLGEAVPVENSILKICSDKKIPIFCPAIADSGIGLQVWNFIQDNKLPVDAFQDLKEILDISWDCEKSAIFYVGGGVPKNYVQQAMQFSKAASFGVQITTDRPEPGGSSGAEMRESQSWGKLSHDAKFEDVICDATIALPIIHASLKHRLG